MSNIKSQDIKAGIRHGFANGSSKMGNRICYGYARNENGELIINAKESPIVQWIFQAYLAGATPGKIVKQLMKYGIPAPSGHQCWKRQTVEYMLSNEKYIGEALLQKTITENGRKVRNAGMEPRYRVYSHHDQIIASDLFQQVCKEKLHRPQSYRHKVEIDLPFPKVQ